MKKQPDITEGMRCILVDWLVEVTEEFKLDQHTLYMALSIVDRYLLYSQIEICTLVWLKTQPQWAT